MTLQKVLLFSAIAALAFSTGCSTEITHQRAEKPLINQADRDLGPEHELRTAAYIKTYATDEGAVAAPVALASPVPLKVVMSLALPAYPAAPGDEGVDMGALVNLSTPSMPALKFLEILGAQTGYEFTLDGHSIQVHAYQSKQWLLPMFTNNFSNKEKVKGSTTQTATVTTSGSATGAQASQSSGSSGDDRGIEVSYKNEIDEWESVVDNARNIMGAPKTTAATPRADSAGSAVVATGRNASLTNNGIGEVVANRSQGVIRAFGPVARIRRLDAYLHPLIAEASRQVRLDVRELEVTINDEKAQGINWSAIANTVFNQSKGMANLTLGGMFPGSTSTNGLSVNGSAKNTDDSVSSLVSLLSTYGDVEIRNEPQVTQLNGRTSYVGSGEEFGYVASIQQTISNGAVVSTPTLQRILVGVEIAITPRMLDDDRIMLEVVPIISTFKNFDTFTISGSTFSQPRIVLSQFATNVITRSGEPVELGGLITSSLSKTLTTVPVEEGVFLKLLQPVFGGSDNTLARRELVIVVTPTMVGA